MSTFNGPNTLEDFLVLSVDSENIKSYPYHPGTADHGISNWYCFAANVVTYSTTEPNTTIYQITDTGVVSVLIANSATPSRGTFTPTAGYQYYGDKPINLVAEDWNHSIAPLSMAAKLFMHLPNRAGSEAGLTYFYSPYGTTTITQYTGGTGVNGTLTATLALAANVQGSFATAAIGAWYYYTSTLPVIASAYQTVGTDKTVLSPVVMTSYQRYISNYATSIGGTPTTVGNFVVSDTTYPVMTMNIADGSGGDSAQGLGLEYLCDRYSWGNVCSDYVIAAPYENTFVSTQYWNGSAWVVWENHSLTGGSILNPTAIYRDGTLGPGVAGVTINGTAANMASGATLWKWEGNNPFYLCINDSQDDEFSVLGWTSTRTTRTVSDRDVNMYDMSSNANHGTVVNGALRSTNGLMLNYARSQYVTFPNSSNLRFLNRDPCSFEAWVYPTRNPGANNWTGIICREGNPGSGRDGYNLYLNGSATTTTYLCFERWYTGTTAAIVYSIDSSIIVNSWSHVVGTYNGSVITLYRNGVQVGGQLASTGNMTNANDILRIGVLAGAFYFDGKVSVARVYAKCLTATEVIQQFNAHRGRYGI